MWSCYNKHTELLLYSRPIDIDQINTHFLEIVDLHLNKIERESREFSQQTKKHPFSSFV